jgi:hypothetical protein
MSSPTPALALAPSKPRPDAGFYTRSILRGDSRVDGCQEQSRERSRLIVAVRGDTARRGRWEYQMV